MWPMAGANGVVSEGIAECHLEVEHILGTGSGGVANACTCMFHFTATPAGCSLTSHIKILAMECVGGDCGGCNDWMTVSATGDAELRRAAAADSLRVVGVAHSGSVENDVG